MTKPIFYMYVLILNQICSILLPVYMSSSIPHCIAISHTDVVARLESIRVLKSHCQIALKLSKAESSIILLCEFLYKYIICFLCFQIVLLI